MRFKRGATGEGVLMMYRVFMIIFIATTIMVLSAIFYDYKIDIRDAQAVIAARNLVDCIAPEGVLDAAELRGYGDDILTYCGYSSEDPLYVRASVARAKRMNLVYTSGGSSAAWSKKLFEEGLFSQGILDYEPGYIRKSYHVNVLEEDGSSSFSLLSLEVVVEHE